MVEAAAEKGLIGLDKDWRDLVSRADAPNVFMDPALIRFAAHAYPNQRSFSLLAWQDSACGRRLVGAWGFAHRRPAHAIALGRVLTAPAMPHGYLATPVIDRLMIEDVLAAMLDFIATDRTLPNIVATECFGTDCATMAALKRVLAARRCPPSVLRSWVRPKLAATSDPARYLATALSAATRKKLRQHRNRLARRGTLQYRVIREPDAVRAAMVEFLRMESSGWKGRRGTALLDDSGDAKFAKDIVAALADRGDAALHALYLNEAAVSMQIVLHSGPAAFTWKTAYDENLQDFSPGMLLLEDYTANLLADENVAFVDSCAFQENGYMAAWTERQGLVSIWLDARPGHRIALNAVAGLNRLHLRLRWTVKAVYKHSGRVAARYRRLIDNMNKRLSI